MIDFEDIAHKRLADTKLTVQDLVNLVKNIVTERLGVGQSEAENSDLADWWQSMITDIIMPVSGIPSATDMLREERDHWYKSS